MNTGNSAGILGNSAGILGNSAGISCVFFSHKTSKIRIGAFFLVYARLITRTDLINMNYAKLAFIVRLFSNYPVCLAIWMLSHMRGMVEAQHLPTFPQFLAFRKSDSQVGWIHLPQFKGWMTQYIETTNIISAKAS